MSKRIGVLIIVLLASMAVGQVSGSPGVTGAGGTISSGTLLQPGVYTSATGLGTSPTIDSPEVPMGTFHEALRNSQSQVVNIALIGNSITAGLGTTGPNWANDWAQQLSLNLHSTYGNHGYGIIVVSNSNGSWQPTGSWSTVSTLGPTQTGATAFNTLYTASGNTNSYALASYYGDSLRVYTAVDNSTSGACTVQIDGGNVGTTTASGAGALTTQVDTFASVLGYHTANIIAPASGTCYLYGAEWTVGSAGVSIHNFAVSGATSRSVGLTTSAQLAYLAAIPGNLHLAIIALGTNDYHTASYGITSAEYTTNIQSVITYLKALSPAPAILILDEHVVDCAPGDGFTCSATFTQPALLTAEKNLAQTNSIGFVSISEVWGTYAAANTAGLINADHVHPSTLGHLYYDYQVENSIVKRQQPPILQGDGTLGSTSIGQGNMSVIGTPFQNNSTTFATVPGIFNTLFGVKAGFNVNLTSQSISAFGNNAGSIFTTQQSGNAFGASACSSSGSSGLASNATHVICLGDGAQVKQSNATQIGPGTNNTNGTLQFWGFNFLTASGAAAFATTKSGTAGTTPGFIDLGAGYLASAMAAQSSASCTNVTGMTWTIAASKNYVLSCELPVTFAASATLQMCLGGPGTATSYSLEADGPIGAAAVYAQLSTLAQTAYGTKTGASGAPGAAEWVHVQANIQNGSTASGTALTLQTAGNGTNNITVGANASCVLTQVN